MTTRHSRLRRRVFNLAGLLGMLCLFCPSAKAHEEPQHWEIFTKDGPVKKPQGQPVQQDIGLGTSVDVSSHSKMGQGRGVDIRFTKHPEIRRPMLQEVLTSGITSLAEDGGGNLWVGTLHGLCAFDGRGWSAFFVEEWINKVVVDKAGYLWVSGSNGARRSYEQAWTLLGDSVDGNWMMFENAGDEQIGRVADIAVAPNGDVWVAAGVLYQFTDHGGWKYSIEDGIPSPGVTLLAIDQYGTVWGGLPFIPEPPFPGYELVSFDGRQWTVYDLPSPYPQGYTPLDALFADQSNRILAATPMELLIRDGEQWRSYKKPDGGRFNVIAMYQEQNQKKGKRLWLSEGDAFGFLEERTWTWFPYEELQMVPKSMLVDHNGDLWMGLTKLVRWPSADQFTEVEESHSPSLPKSLTLFQNYPNPFNPETQFTFQLPHRQELTLEIFSTTGCLVKRLIDSEYEAGIYHASWDGRNSEGTLVASGLYFYRLASGGEHITHKMVLLK